MGSDIILCMALIASFAFVIQFLLSILGSDLDTDIDNASDLSMSLSDIISFKGITHFILGYSWTTYFSGSHLVGVVIGSFFFIVLFYVYKLLLKLKQEMVYECPEDLNGREVEIVFRSGKNHYMVNISKNGRQEQMRVRCLSGKTYKNGDKVNIKYKEGYYESIVITIGNGEGNNWWCFLFPNLCLVDLQNKTDIEYKSWLVKQINKIF